MPYTFELHVSGICLFEFDRDPPTRCTIYVPSALFPDGVAEFQTLGENMPYPHHPSLSFPIRLLAKIGQNRPRQPDEIRPDGEAEELAIYYLDGDDLELTSRGASSLQVNQKPGDPHNFDQTVDVDELLQGSGVQGTFDRKRATTKVTFDIGDLETLALGKVKGEVLTYRVEDIAHTLSLPERKLAEVEVLRLHGLKGPVVFASSNPLRPYIALAAENADDSVIRASLTNLHRRVVPNRPAIFDFFWYYGLFTLEPAPSMRNLLLPWLPSQLGGARTSSGGECPPTKRTLAPAAAPTASAPQAVPVTRDQIFSQRVSFAQQSVARGLAGKALVDDFLAQSGLKLSLKARLRPMTDLDGLVRNLAQVQNVNAALASIGGTQLTAATDFAPECVALGTSIQGASGVLVLPDIVLTAAHVIDEVDWERVGFGTDASKPTDTRIGIGYRIHPDYQDKPTLLNDLAVILLDRDVTNVNPPVLASSTEIQGAAKLTIVGFGETAKYPRGTKNSIEASKLATGEDGFIFAGEAGLDSCTGDSGGPAYVKDAGGALLLAALVSHNHPILGGPVLPCGSGGAYQLIEEHLPWINKMVKELRSAAGSKASSLLKL